MSALHERLAELVTTWRADGYASDEFPAIAEVLEFAGETEAGELRYLRRPQLRGLETYWYLRLVEDTPHIFDLYLRTFPPETDKQGLFDALGVPETAFRDANYELDDLWELVRTDDDFVRKHRLEALRETLTLDYPSYISDVPERKSDLISGTYELDAPKGKTTVAVKIVDMLGEEALVTKQV